MNNLSTSNFITILIISLIPTFLLLSSILYSDRKSREPIVFILICIFSGFFTIGLSLLLGQIILPKLNIISSGLFTDTGFDIFKIIILAAVEEYSKLLVLYLFISHNSSFDDIYDGFVYSAIIALSFAGMETLTYVFSEPDFESMKSLAILRDFTTIPLHLVCGIIMGHFVAIERFSKTKIYKVRKITNSLLMPTIVHSIYNVFFSIILLLFRNSSFLLLIVLIFILSVYALGIIFIKKTVKLNEVFISNGTYPKNYNYLMTKKDFINKNNNLDIYNY